jgi:GTP-binding protein HflX
VMPISAVTGEGMDALLDAIAGKLTQGHRRYTIALDPADGAGAAWLHQHGEVCDHWVEGDTVVYEVRMAPRDFERFETRG